MNARWFRKIVRRALEEMTPDLPDVIPPSLREKLGLIPRQEAFWKVHWPDENVSLSQLQGWRTPAHIRLIFEELFFLELGLEIKRRKLRQQPGIAFALDKKSRDALKRILPFHPTAAQKRVLKDIAEDMSAPTPMRRLLQGDVGAGKTIVAFQAAIIAIENGYQVALMAPTEILATQHYLSARKILENAGYRIVLLTGSLEQERKRDVRRHIAAGDAQLVIGTHALIQDKVEFDNLGLVIVDEQHRFGVMQRLKLMRKSNGAEALTPDMLVMTATPIPRTLALSFFADFDVTTIDALPPGRQKIVTQWYLRSKADEAYKLLRQEIAFGRQGYIVVPHVEESGLEDAKSVTAELARLTEGPLKGLRLAPLHGQMKADEKQQAMRAFRAGETDILIATTVIEVGIDVPNATVMLIDNAERFGLSQLHQLRGRVGRGEHKSHCLLISDAINDDAVARLRAMTKTNDGFEIAEMDLKLRGPGQFFGTRQHGLPEFKLADLTSEISLLAAARDDATKMLDADPNLARPEHKALRAALTKQFGKDIGLAQIG
jgi:ATP-dependent DNA helicase RecG